MLKNIFFLIFLYFPLLQAQKTLTELANDCGTDKGYAHNYMPTYDIYFSHLQNMPINFLEIGFQNGNSAHMWDHYFLQANLYFIDIDPECFEKYSAGLSSKCHFHIANQADKEDLLRFIGKTVSSI